LRTSTLPLLPLHLSVQMEGLGFISPLMQTLPTPIKKAKVPKVTHLFALQ
jgi:hypothetical protein